MRSLTALWDLRSPAELREDLEALGLTIEETCTAEEAIRAGELIHLSRAERDQHGGATLALGDALCLASAERLNLPAVTGDRLWFDVTHLLLSRTSAMATTTAGTTPGADAARGPRSGKVLSAA